MNLYFIFISYRYNGEPIPGERVLHEAQHRANYQLWADAVLVCNALQSYLKSSGKFERIFLFNIVSFILPTIQPTLILKPPVHLPHRRKKRSKFKPRHPKVNEVVIGDEVALHELLLGQSNSSFHSCKSTNATCTLRFPTLLNSTLIITNFCLRALSLAFCSLI